MLRLIVRRLVILILAVALANLVGFAYAHIGQRVLRAENPYGSSEAGLPPLGALYADYLKGLLRGDLGNMPVGVDEPVTRAVAQAALASLGLLGIAFVLSLLLGLALGVSTVRVDTGWVSRWLVPAATAGLAMPSFYVGTLCIMALVVITLRGGPDAVSPLPVQGFGWDAHLVLPVLALMVRPTLQIASLTAGLLSAELGQPYIIAARSRGNSWTRIRWRHSLRSVLAPVVLAAASSLRLLLGELIVVEWLFAWPGVGRLLALTLIAPRIGGPAGLSEDRYFLYPSLVAALLAVFTLLFLLIDSGALVLARASDPRLSVPDEDARRA